MRIIILGLALSVCAASHAGATTSGRLGLQACKTWADDRKMEGPSLYADESWVTGLLSGIAYSTWVGADPPIRIDTDGVYNLIDIYCVDHPTDTMTVAAEAFYHSHPRAPKHR